MAELQPPVEPHVNGGAAAAATTTTAFPTATLPTEPIAGPAKRQRRPSVRLGEIGDQLTSYDNPRRTKPQQQQWKYTSSKDPKSSNKTRHLTNLSIPMEFHETLDRGGGGPEDKINHNTAIGSWKVRDSSKSKRGFSSTKRARTSNWSSKTDDGDERFEKFEEEEIDYDHDNNVDDGGDDGYRDFDREGSADLNYGSRSRDGARVRVSDGVELDGVSDADARNWNNSDLERNGVRVWLNQLGLGRYFPIFEVHEVDDEVLPLLTLEDLKDMGINAVGSRRKMFCSIQKLGKGFS